MANKAKGEEPVEIAGTTYTLFVNMEAWAIAQDALTKGDDVPPLELLEKRLKKGHFLTIIAIFLGALRKHHPDIDTMKKASTLMEKANDADAVALALVRAVFRASADKNDLAELGQTANPTRAQGVSGAQVGTGEKRSSRPAASA